MFHRRAENTKENRAKMENCQVWYLFLIWFNQLFTTYSFDHSYQAEKKKDESIWRDVKRKCSA